jgi:hypothetical protein
MVIAHTRIARLAGSSVRTHRVMPFMPTGIRSQKKPATS